MSTDRNEINDNEIRVISPDGDRRARGPRRRRRNILFASVAVAAVVGLCLTWGLTSPAATADEPDCVVTDTVAQTLPAPEAETAGYVTTSDTTVNGLPLTILYPHGAVPSLSVGPDAMDDSTAVLMVQAADVRGDNGEILGAYVMRGNLLSRGQSKAGFCAIIDGKISVGTADATPMLEQAIETEGYFFRQYPLVAGGQVVENKPRGRSLRKALAIIDGQPAVIMSMQRATFHDFAQALTDIGVSDAIYLCGSSSPAFAVDNQGHRIEYGIRPASIPAKVNFIVWR